MKKKLWIISLFTLLLFALTSCGKANQLPPDFNAMTAAEDLEALTVTVLQFNDTDLEIASHELESPFSELCAGTLTAIQEAGQPLQLIGTTFTTNEENVIATVEVVHEERNVEYEYTYAPNPAREYNPSAEPYVMIQVVVSPEYTFQELMSEAGMNTLMGMGVVFVVLIFISFVISLLKYLPGSGARKRPEKKEKPKAPVAAPAASSVTTGSENLMDNQELVAVITAAIMAASQGGPAIVSSDQLIVRSIKRVSR